MDHGVSGSGSMRVKALTASYEAKIQESATSNKTSRIGHTGSLEPPSRPTLEKTELVAKKLIEERATATKPPSHLSRSWPQELLPPPDIPLPQTPDDLAALARINKGPENPKDETVSSLWKSSHPSITASQIGTARPSQVVDKEQAQINAKTNTRIDSYQKAIAKIAADRKSKLSVQVSKGEIPVSTTKRLFGFSPGKSASTKRMVADLKDLAFKALETNDPKVIGRYYNMLTDLRASPWGQSLNKNKDMRETLDQISRICIGELDDPAKLDGLEAAMDVATAPLPSEMGDREAQREFLIAARDTLANVKIPSEHRKEFNAHLDKNIELIEDKLKVLNANKLVDNFDIADKAKESNNPKELREARKFLDEAKLIGPNSKTYNEEIQKHIAKIDLELRKLDVSEMKDLLLTPTGQDRDLFLNSALWVIKTEDYIEPFQAAIQEFDSANSSALASLVDAGIKLSGLSPEELGKTKNNSTLGEQLETIYVLTLDHPDPSIAKAGEVLNSQLHRFSEDNITTQIFGRGEPAQRELLLQSASVSPQSFIAPLKGALDSLRSSYPFHPERKEGHTYVQVSHPEFISLVEAGITLSKLPYTYLSDTHEGTSLKEQLELLMGFAVGYESEQEPELTRLGRELDMHLKQVPAAARSEASEPALRQSQAEIIGHFIDATPMDNPTIISDALRPLAKGTLNKSDRDNLLINLSLDVHAMTRGAVANIDLNELRQKNIGNKAQAPTVGYAIEVTNDLTNKVTGSIHQGTSLRETQRLIGFYVDLSTKLAEENNFMGAMAIYSALNETSVLRIIDQAPKTLNETQKANLARLNTLFDPSVNFQNYRSAVKDAQNKGVVMLPAFNLLVSDITFIKEGNLDVLDSKSNLTKTDMLSNQEQNFRTIQERLGRGVTFRTDFFKSYDPILRNKDNQVVERKTTAGKKAGEGEHKHSEFIEAAFEHSKLILPSKRKTT